MHVPQLLHPLLRTPYVEIVEARLPEGPSRFLAEPFALSRVSTLSPRQQGPCRALFQHLHHCRWIPYPGSVNRR